MVHLNRPDIIQQIKELIYKRLSKYTRSEHLELLIKCMDFTGYIYISTESSPNYLDFTEVEYSVIRNKGRDLINQEELLPSVINFNSIIQGTSIQKDPKFSRLNITQTYGITSDEMTSAYLNDLFESVLNHLNYSETKLVKQYSIKMYFDLVYIYRQTNRLKGEMKATIKRGYTVLVLYYSLLQFESCIKKEDLIVHFNNASSGEFSISDLAEADKNIKIVFGEKLPNENEICLCNMKSLFDKPTINLLKLEIARLKENGTFHTPVQVVQIAALIHHITNQSVKNISHFSGISPDTIHKAVKQFNFSSQ